MPTLREVAARAGVSVATASRVATGSAAVRPETRRRVEGAMRDLLYVTPGAKPATGAIGLLLPELSNPIFPALAQAMEARATAAGLASILGNTTGAGLREADYVHMLLDHRVDGFIFISCEMTHLAGDHDHYGMLLQEGARLVFVNGALDNLNVPSIGVDERHAGQLATQHLIDLGHRLIGFVAGPADYVPTREKGKGRLEALAAVGVAPDRLVAHGEFSVDGGGAALRELMLKTPRPTGVICSSDLMAIGALQQALELGLRVPDDLSIVGFDGIEAGGWTSPPLTTIEQPIDDIAATAVDALRTLIAEPGRALPSFVFKAKLRRRGSTGPAPLS